MKLETKVNNKIKEMFEWNDTTGLAPLMEEIKDTKDITLNHKVQLVTKLARAKERIVGTKYDTRGLMSTPRHFSRNRKVSYRAKYTGNFSGGATGSARTTRS